MDYEVVIIGAGAAGLAAAAELAPSAARILVLEARDRVGGRVWTRSEAGLPAPVELGAEFIHGAPPVTLALLRRAGIAAVDAPIVRWAFQDGKLAPRGEGVFEEIVRALRRHAKPLARKDIPFATFLEKVPHGLSDEAVMFARIRAQGYEGADPARLSARVVAEEWAGPGEQHPGHSRPAGGYGALVDSLARTLGGAVELRLGSVVRAVRWKRGSVEVEIRRQTPDARRQTRGEKLVVTAKKVIVTLPLGVLQAAPRARGAVRFEPALTQKRSALKGLVSGTVVKAPLLFRTAFWEEADDARYRGVTFFHAPAAAFPTLWTAAPVRAPLLNAWAGGPKAARLCGKPMREIVRRAVSSLETVFGQSGIEDLLQAAWVHDWRSDPYARGAYSYVAVGGHGARKALAAPLQKTLYFAGEATDSDGEPATVAGALQSGQRAAREVIRDG